MTEADAGPIFDDYERVSKRANDLYEEAEGLIGIEGSGSLFRELMGSCAHLEEQAFFMSMGVGVGNLIRDTHARYVVQNFYRAGLYGDVKRLGKKVLAFSGDDRVSQATADQIRLYRDAAKKIAPDP